MIFLFPKSTAQTNTLFIGIIHQIYTRYGIAPFERASSISGTCILFYFLFRRISRNPAQYRRYDAMKKLLKKYTTLAPAQKSARGWAIMNIADRWGHLEPDTGYGCHYGECPERMALKKLKSQRKRGRRDAVVEERLYKWGAEAKACKCWKVIYCSRDCQAKDWRNHRAACRVDAEQDNEI